MQDSGAAKDLPAAGVVEEALLKVIRKGALESLPCSGSATMRTLHRPCRVSLQGWIRAVPCATSVGQSSRRVSAIGRQASIVGVAARSAVTGSRVRGCRHSGMSRWMKESSLNADE